MNYSTVGIANVALQRIGARGTIASLTENSPNAIKINVCWDYIFQEVLSERDWKFAKLRVELPLSTLQPIYGYQFAYSLPADFLRLVKIRPKPHYTDPNWMSTWDWAYNRDLPVWPNTVAPFIIETIPNADASAYNKFLLTNFNTANDPSGLPLAINYIRLITDLTQCWPAFVNCLANRLAAELAISITEDKQKAAGFMQEYRDSLNSAEAQNACDDYVADESGSNSWVMAGRRFWGYGQWGQ